MSASCPTLPLSARLAPLGLHMVCRWGLSLSNHCAFTVCASLPFLVESPLCPTVCVFTAFPCRITFVSHCVRFHCLQAAQSLPITVCVHCVRVHCRQVARQTLNPVWNAQYTLTVENLATPLIIEAFVSRARDTRLLAVFACQSFLSIAADL